MYNKNYYQKFSGRKILHKVKKQWVAISLALLMMIGGVAVASHAHASVTSANQSQAVQVVQNNGSKNNQTANSQNQHNNQTLHNIHQQAQALHANVIRHVSQTVAAKQNRVRNTGNNQNASQQSVQPSINHNHNSNINRQPALPAISQRTGNLPAVRTSAPDNPVQDFESFLNLVKIVSQIFEAENAEANNNSNNNVPVNNQEYVLNTRDMITSDNLHKLETGGSYQYGAGLKGVLVNVNKQHNFDGYNFDYITNPNGGNSDNDNNVWIYNGELNKDQDAPSSDINLNQLYVNYVNNHAPEFLQQMKTKSLNFINQAREQSGLRPLKEDPTMDQLANLRAKQLTQNYGHYNSDGQPYVEIDAPKFNISSDPGWGENIAQNYIESDESEPTDPNHYDASDGNGIAYAANNNMLNYDSHSDWGHRENMLNPNDYLIGLGSAYNPNNQSFSLDEAFYHYPSIVPANINNSNQEYVLNTKDTVTSDNLHKAETGAPYHYGDGTKGTLVNVVKQQNFDGYLFDYITNPNGGDSNNDNNVWIYAGELNKDPYTQSSDIDLNQLYYNYVNSNASRFVRQIKGETLNDINEDRMNNGVQPLVEDSDLDQLANMRANQLTHNFSSYNDQGQLSTASDAPQLNISLDPGWDEVYSRNSIDSSDTISSDPNTYNVQDGVSLADASNDSLINYDNSSRNMILNPNPRAVGVGVSYNPNDHRFYTDEIFYDSPDIVPYFGPDEVD